MENVEQKPYLQYYSGVKGISVFLNQIYDSKAMYDYVVIINTTLLNFLTWYCEELNLDKFTSANGLLANASEIISFYEKNNRFPEILIVSDVEVDGTEIAKFLKLLESFVYKELLQTTKRTINGLRRDFADAISMLVYQRNESGLFIDGRYHDNFTYHGKMISSDLRDVSLQICDALSSRYGQELNTFSPAILNTNLKDKLLEKINNHQGINNGWSISKIRYYEEMIFACKLISCNHIATIRLFPNRGRYKRSGRPWITSHTILGMMKEDTVNELSKIICSAFNWSIDTPLGNMLLSDRKHSKRARNYLLNLIISLFDLIEFISDVKIDEINLRENNLDKISLFLGVEHTEILNQLACIISNPSKVLEIKQKIDEILARESSQIVDVNDFNKITKSKENIQFDQTEIFDAVSKIIWNISVNRGNTLHVLKEKPYLFRPDLYQSYSEYFYLKLRTKQYEKELIDGEGYGYYEQERYGSDGVISFGSFFDLLKHGVLVRKQNYYDLFPLYLASYFMFEDMGMIESSIEICTLHSNFIPLVKTTVLSEILFPKKVVWFLSAFAIIEGKCYRWGLSELQACVFYYSEMKKQLSNDTINIIQELGLTEDEIKEYDDYIKQLPSEEEFSNDLKLLYAAGASFRGWNFNAMYYPYKLIVKMSEYLQSVAKKKLGLDEPETTSSLITEPKPKTKKYPN